MKLPNTKFDKCAATNADVRYYLREPWFDADHERILATNGHVMAVIPVEADPDDTTGPVPMEAVKAVRKVHKKDGDLLLEPGHANAYGDRYPRADHDKYPDVKYIIEPLDDGKGEADIVLDAKLLYDLAQALIECKTTEAARVRLFFKKDEEGTVDKKAAIRVVPMGPGSVADAFGIIMPCRE